MRKVKIEEWDAKGRSGENVKESLLSVFDALLGGKKPEEIPKGWDKFRLFRRISKAFEKARKSKVLELEEQEYSFLKGLVEKDIPSVWGSNSNISGAVEAFMEAKVEEVKEEKK